MTSNRQTVKSMPEWFFALVTGAIAFGLTVLFFRNSWWGPDDGIYALVADQMLKGKILFKDIQEIHPGYIDFTNAAVMKLFGRDILVLRYPLLLLFTIEAVLAYFLLKKSYPKSVAILCALIFPLLSYALFNNITANWYAQFLAFILGGVFAGVIPVNRHRTLIIGIIVGLAIMFRQTTGVFIGFAALPVFSHALSLQFSPWGSLPISL
jgi:4-amino-4-deoxy-L-arabinose transferase-like glycosyltransferase